MANKNLNNRLPLLWSSMRWAMVVMSGERRVAGSFFWRREAAGRERKARSADSTHHTTHVKSATCV